MIDLTLSLELSRQETLKEIVFGFLSKSIVRKSGIQKSLDDIDIILNDLMVDNSFLGILKVEYWRSTPSMEDIRVGWVKFEIDWEKHKLFVKNNSDEKIIVDKDDPLDSLSAALSDLANFIKEQAIKQGVNSLDYTIQWCDKVTISQQNAARKRLGLSRITPESRSFKANQKEDKQMNFIPGRFPELALEINWNTENNN